MACPFRDDSYACGSHLQEREIRAVSVTHPCPARGSRAGGSRAGGPVLSAARVAQLVSPEEYRRFLERSLVLAERRSPNSFHCRSSDCPGWCIYEDSVNEFRCPVCGALNCLLCKVGPSPGPALGGR